MAYILLNRISILFILKIHIIISDNFEFEFQRIKIKRCKPGRMQKNHTESRAREEYSSLLPTRYGREIVAKVVKVGREGVPDSTQLPLRHIHRLVLVPAVVSLTGAPRQRGVRSLIHNNSN